MVQVADMIDTLNQGVVVITKDWTFNEDVTIGSTGIDILTVNANAVFNDDVVFAGTSVVQFQSSVTITVSGISTFNGDATFNGNVTLGSSSADNLTVHADAVFNGDVVLGSSIFDTITITGTTVFENGYVVTAGEINFAGTSVFNWNLATSGSAGALQGYLNIRVAGTNRRIPYYAVLI